MTKSTEPQYSSHPAHVIHHIFCGHILRRVLKDVPGDKSGTGCMCSDPPEMKWQTRRAEYNGIPCEIDELVYEARSLPIECNSCFAIKMGYVNPEVEDMSRETKSTRKRSGRLSSASKKKAKSQRKKGLKRQSSLDSAKSESSISELEMDWEETGVQLFVSGTELDIPKESGRKSSRRNSSTSTWTNEHGGEGGDFESGSIEDRVWKALRSRDVHN